ncbi:MAG: zinc ribbon domain-containing protein [Thermomicrobiales bacterium]
MSAGHCPRCGTLTEDRDKFCVNCGFDLSQQATRTPLATEEHQFILTPEPGSPGVPQPQPQASAGS